MLGQRSSDIAWRHLHIRDVAIYQFVSGSGKFHVSSKRNPSPFWQQMDSKHFQASQEQVHPHHESFLGDLDPHLTRMECWDEKHDAVWQLEQWVE